MTTSGTVALHLPYLRRYARALTGNQQSGDAYVAAALEALIKDPGTLTRFDNPRVGLFHIFSVIWNSVAVNAEAEPADITSLAERRLGYITSRPRQAFLLVSVEGFSETDAAAILGIEVADLRQLIEDCGRELAREIATDILIIEDEEFIALDLEALVEKLGHRVVGIGRTHREAKQLADAHHPGLILADIQLADGSSGLEAVNEILASFEVPVIFITAYPERFLTGERPEPAFLIAKPYQPATVSAIVSQALFFQRNAAQRKRRATA